MGLGYCNFTDAVWRQYIYQWMDNEDVHLDILPSWDILPLHLDVLVWDSSNLYQNLYIIKDLVLLKQVCVLTQRFKLIFWSYSKIYVVCKSFWNIYFQSKLCSNKKSNDVMVRYNKVEWNTNSSRIIKWCMRKTTLIGNFVKLWWYYHLLKEWKD